LSVERTVTRSLRTLGLSASILLALLISALAPFSGAPTPALAAGTIHYVNSGTGTTNSTCSRDMPCKTIQGAIDVSHDGDGIQIETAGPYSETLLITPSVVISGADSFAPGSGPTIVDPSLAGQTGSVATIPAMTATVGLYDLVLQHGSATRGGGIFNNGATVALTATTVQSNTAGEGGGIYNDVGGTLTLAAAPTGGLLASVPLTGSNVLNNTATNGNGGGIVGAVGSTVTVSDSAVLSDTAVGDGGGILENGALTVSGSPVVSNTAAGSNSSSGGGIDAQGALTVSGSPVMSNTVTFGIGGGIYAQSALTVTASPVLSNTAAGGGGGIYGNDAVAVTDHSPVQGNAAAGGPGGGIDAQGALTVTTSPIMSNTAGAPGGGIFGNGVVTVSGSPIVSNTATNPGGGIYAQGALAITDSPIVSNTATNGPGGGIYAGGALTVTTSQGVSNTATTGEGGGIFAGGAALLSGSPVLSNTAGGDGGGIAAFSAVTVLTGTLRGNRAGGQGGALASGGSTGPGTARVRASTLADNRAARGGAIAVISGSLALVNSTLSGNVATLGGGGAITTSGTLNVTASTLAVNTARSGVGGALNTTSSGTATLTNTLLAANTDGSGANSCAGSLGDGGYNLEFPSNTCGFSAANNDQVGNPLLASMLADNGGPTPTLAVGPGGAAVGHGNGDVCRQTGPDAVDGVDQRGFPRPASGPCTIGAFEPQQTTLLLTSAPNPSVVGQQVSLTATVAASPTEANPVTGTVTFTATDASGAVTSRGSAPTLNGTAAISTTFTSAGAYTVTATFTGTDTLSSTATISQTVDKADSATMLTSAPNPSQLGQRVDLTATVAISAPAVVTPTGVVTFTDGLTTLGSAPLDRSGTATFSTTALSAGTHMLTAIYGGDANVNGSSGTRTQRVNAPASTATPTGAATATATASPTSTNTSTPAASATGTAAPTSTGAATTTPTSTATATATATTTGAAPPTATGTPRPVTATATGTAVPTSTGAATTAPSNTNTPTSTGANTAAPPTSTGTAVPPTSTGTAIPTTAPTRTSVLAPAPSLTRRFCLAGGVETTGTQAELALLNANGGPAHVMVTLYFADGAVHTATITVPATAQRGYAVADLTAQRGSFGLCVAADRPVSSQLNLTRPGQDGDSELGSPTLGYHWALAEGYTDLTFHETVALLNPNGQATTVSLRLLLPQGDGDRTVTERVGAHSERVVDINRLAPRTAVSLVADADRPILVERTLTFSRGQSSHGQSGYGLTMRDAAPDAATSWLFAEGSTRAPFQTFLTILNPGKQSTLVTASFFGRDGGRLGRTTLTVAGLSRATLRVNALAPDTSGVASVVTSDRPIVVERPEYFGSPNARDVAGSDVFGRTSVAEHWAIPGGTLATGDSEFLLLYNPSARAARVALTFYNARNGGTVTTEEKVPAGARSTFDVSGFQRGTRMRPGPQLAASHGAVVHMTNGVGIVVEHSVFGRDHSTLQATQGLAQ